MLSIGKMVAGAEDYYLRTVADGREEYYTGSGEAPGEWVGRGSAELGLAGEVLPADLRAVLAGRSPAGQLLSDLQVDPRRRVAGFDLTWSAPKSVSLLYGLGDAPTADTVRRAHAEAVQGALDYLETHGLRVRRGAGGEQKLAAGGLVAAAFVHRTSRAGDPQLHTHVLVANVARGSDGRWSALDARRLYFHARTAGFLYQAVLRARLTDDLGVRFGPVTNGTAELADVSPVLLRAFSTRRAEIVRHLEEVGATSARAAEIAALATRSPKDHLGLSGVDLDPTAIGAAQGLRERWRARAEDLDVADPTLAGLLRRHRRREVGDGEVETLVAALTGPEGLTAQDAAFERRDVVRAVAAALPDGACSAEVAAITERVLADGEVQALSTTGRGGERRHTTAELLATERAVLDGALARRHTGVAVVGPDALEAALGEHLHLAEEQVAMVHRLATSGAGVEVVVGKAGAGKTAALIAAREAWERAGHRVLGTALAARAAKGLEEGAGIPSTTVARLLTGLGNGAVTLGPGDVLVVDEAGMVGTRMLGRLLEAAGSAGAKAVLVGDPRQLPEIEAGGTFGALGRRLGAIELTENRRQEAAWERAALDELRHGEPGRGLAAFADNRRVRVATDMADARRQLVEGWLAARGTGEDAVMLAVNRRDVAALNAAARLALRAAGLLGDDLVELAGVGLAAGDVVVCLRNDPSLGVLNGTRGLVDAADEHRVVLATGDSPRILPASYVAAGHLDHGYAVTVHKAQGATVDRTFVLATDALTREAGYVAMSRARRGTELFVPASAFDDGLEIAHTSTGRSADPLGRVVGRFGVSRAKQPAIDELEVAAPAENRRAARRTGVAPSSWDVIDEGDDPEPVIGDDGPRLRGAAVATPRLQPAARPGYLAVLMGERPAFADEREAYDRVAHLVTGYRARYGIEGDDPLGALPLEATQRAAHAAVLAQLRTYQRRLGRSLALDGLDLGRGR